MDTDQIKKELSAQGFDFSMLAQALGKSPSLISKVAARKARSRVVAEALAKALNKPIEQVFPDIVEYQGAPLTKAEKQKKQRELAALLSK
ncbi:MAG: hypothetical protein WEA82_06770 [Idiomarina sp.]